MTKHVFGAVVTGLGTAANNRGITEGNITTLQKLVWEDAVHTTVSAEAIRFALRRHLDETEDAGTNRRYDDAERVNTWEDPSFERWGSGSTETPFIDDDLLGFMIAEAPKQEGEKGSAKVRRAVLEITRAVSLTPWPGDVTFNAASPGATPSAQKKGSNPVPYGTEMHATRYQYGFSMTPEKLHKVERAKTGLWGLCSLGPVAGNHGRFLFDFSPESIVLRIADEAAPRVLYCFEQNGQGVRFPALIRKVTAGDISAGELIIGGAVVDGMSKEDKAVLSEADLVGGVKAACEAACKKLGSS